jgi:succinate dehydrogenase/fumarate reductase flavoprotein subunit
VFLEYFVKNVGAYLNDQVLLEKYVREIYSTIEKAAEWGVGVAKDDDGKIAILGKTVHPNWSRTVMSLDMMFPLRARARKLGAKMMNKVDIVKLLTKDNRVIGAVGFNIIDGKFYTFKAKATVIANGSCNYKIRKMWITGHGEGIAAAYWAGAEMRNAEFGNGYYHIVQKQTEAGGIRAENLVNALGEGLLAKYVTEPDPGTAPEHQWRTRGCAHCLPPSFILGWEKEMREGRGPIYLKVEGKAEEVRRQDLFRANAEFHNRAADKLKKYAQPAAAAPVTKVEVEVPLHAEQSCIKVDHEMKTTLPGLWGIGDAVYAGSALLGAITGPPGITHGSGLSFAYQTGIWAGESVARFASGAAAPPDPDYAEVKGLKEEMFAPTQRKKGVSPDDLVTALQDIVCPMEYNLLRKKDRLEEALSKIEDIKHSLPEMQAKDLHYQMKCHETAAMVACAEMMFRAALMRTESRRFHFREDYPQRDDKNWLKWVIVKQDSAGKMALSTEPVPIDRYKIKP